MSPACFYLDKYGKLSSYGRVRIQCTYVSHTNTKKVSVNDIKSPYIAAICSYIGDYGVY